MNPRRAKIISKSAIVIVIAVGMIIGAVSIANQARLPEHSFTAWPIITDPIALLVYSVFILLLCGAFDLFDDLWDSLAGRRKGTSSQ